MRVHLHVDRILLLAQDLHLRYAARHRDALRHTRFGVLVEGPQRHLLRGHRQINDGLVGWIDFREGRRRRHALREQPRSLGNGRLHIHRSAVHAASQVELKRDLGGPERVHRRHLRQTGDG